MARANRSKPIKTFDAEKISAFNPETKSLLRAYRKDMALRELSPGTITGYLNDLDSWLIYVYDNQDNKSVLQLTEDDLTDFFYYCKMQGNNTRRMRRRYSSISAFYKFLRKKRKIQENPMEFVDRPVKDVDVITQTYLTIEQVEKMKKKLFENGDLTLECYALFSLSTMARVNAVANIRWKQINFGERIVTDVLEKEGKFVTLFFSTEVCHKLLQLQQFRDINCVNDGGYVFYGKTKDGKVGAATTSTLYSWARKVGRMIGVPTLHPHDFRHSGSQLLKLAGMPLEDISSLLNHESTETTRKHYLQADTNSIRAAKDKYDF